MAEVVNSAQERTIPEYELMRKHKVFTDEKIRGIVKTRENYQYKLSKNAKSLKDYGEFIIYEKKVHSMVSAIENSRKERFPGLKAAMANRIVRLYKEALRGFPEEGRLWEAYLKFCKNNFAQEVPNAYEKLLQVNKQNEKPSVWINAALWFHSQGNCMDRVKNIFFRGLQRHPECELLYTAFFNILMTETAGQSKEFQDASLERVIAIYNTAKKKICHVSFLINLLKQCDDPKFNVFTKPLQKIIINDMMELYAREERVWDLLAQRELKGASMTEHFNTRITDTEPDDGTANGDIAKVRQPTLKRRIEMCFSIYQTATQTLKTQLMWTLFINAMLDLNTDLSTQQVLKRKKLALAFRSAHEQNCMSEDHYHAYINLLMETKANKEYVISVMTEATSLYGTLKLWEQRLTYHVMEDNQVKVYEIFRRASRQLGVASFPLWKITLQYYQTRYDDQFDRLKEIFKEACERPEPIFGSFRAQYLEWSVVNQTFNATRKLYHELIKLPPPCLELHQRMTALEAQALKPDSEKLRQCHEYIVTDFGKNQVDVWIDYIRFERDDGEPKRMAGLTERAKQTLEPSLVENFVKEHCLLTITS